MTDDALQRRISKFIADAPPARAVNGSADLAIASSLGRVRKENQDRALIVFATYASSPERNFVLGVVCDGLGGMANGAEAAVLASSVFVSRFLRAPGYDPHARLRLAAVAANESVYKLLKGRGGTTIAAVAAWTSGIAICLNVGDSRIYGISADRGVKQLSKDDTLAGYLGHGTNDAHRHELVQYIGMGEGMEPHIVAAHPSDFQSLLITSDGVHNAPAPALGESVRHPASNLDLADRLLSLSDSLGGRDNATVILMPRRVEPPTGFREQGLTLEFWSISNRLEIWIPTISEDTRNQDVPTALTEASNAHVKPSDEARKRRKPPKTSATKSKRSKRGVPDDEDQPPLDITFPDKGDT